MIRGGVEYGLGIFITGVDQTSVASQHGLKVPSETSTEILYIEHLGFIMFHDNDMI